MTDHEPAHAATPEPPYVAVIFTSERTEHGENEYLQTDADLEQLAQQQPGYLGIESAHTPGGLGITVSYWSTDAHARAWKQVAEHLAAQGRGREQWYRRYRVRVGVVEREYGSG